MKSFHKTSLLAEREPAKSGVLEKKTNLKKVNPVVSPKVCGVPKRLLAFFPPLP